MNIQFYNKQMCIYQNNNIGMNKNKYDICGLLMMM